MAQILVRNIEQAVKARLQLRAKRNGRNLEAEVREVLRSAVPKERVPSKRALVGGLGTEIVSLFSKVGLAADIPELRGEFLRSLERPKAQR